EFYCMESKRVFLRSLGCLDDLLLLEEESGKFLEATELEMSLGDVIKESDLLEKDGHFKEAAILLLCLIYFGVRKHHVNGNVVYLLVKKDADWVRKWGQKGLHVDGNRLIIDDRELVFAMVLLALRIT
nr:UvrD-like helicase, ATP-binding domain, P-loop containing nucleoside triphosphate hydrolase [Tanacetum cinerariifolium]